MFKPNCHENELFLLFIYFFKDFLVWTTFKVFTEFVTILLLLDVLGFLAA